MKKLFLLLCVLFCLASSGCFSVSEELTINADGSGLYRLSVKIAGNPYEKEDLTEGDGDKSDKVRDYLKTCPNVTEVKGRKWNEGENGHAMLEVRVKDVTKLAGDLKEAFNRTEPEKAGEVLGQFIVTKNDKGNFEVSRTLQPLKESGEPKTPEDKKQLEEFYKDQYYTTKIYGPGFGSHNGTLAETGKSVEWKIPMQEFPITVDAKKVLTAEVLAEETISLPLPMPMPKAISDDGNSKPMMSFSIVGILIALLVIAVVLKFVFGALSNSGGRD